jgi:hypothetical protein
MFCDEHAPPHFHTSYAEYKATDNIRELCIVKVACLVVQPSWFLIGRNCIRQTLADWDLCQANQHPNPIDPLK